MADCQPPVPPVSHEPRMTGTKHCPTCRLTKPVIAFSVCHRNHDGLNYECRDCTTTKNRQAYKKKKGNISPLCKIPFTGVAGE
jgi:hypothetical protein